LENWRVIVSGFAPVGVAELPEKEVGANETSWVLKWREEDGIKVDKRSRR